MSYNWCVGGWWKGEIERVGFEKGASMYGFRQGELLVIFCFFFIALCYLSIQLQNTKEANL